MSRLSALRRGIEITAVLTAAGSDWFAASMGVRGCRDLSCRWRCAIGASNCPHHAAMEEPLQDRLVKVVERLGPTFVKAGQTLALRPDIVPIRFAHALSRLHEGVEPFDGAAARRLVAEELGLPLSRLFTEFETEPFAAASLSQVHRATLTDGTLVAVKVQRPGLERQVENDMHLLRVLARGVELVRPAAGGLRPSEAVAEVTATLRRELDFQQEGRVTDRVRISFQDDPGIVIPTVHWSHTSRRVLTLDFIDGIRPAAPTELRAGGLDPELVLDVGLRAMFQQIFDHGLFHADPHPGNLRLLPGNRVSFLDFGMFGRVGPAEQRRLALVLWALIEGDGHGLATQLLRVASLRPGAAPEAFSAQVVDELDQYVDDDGTKSIAGLLVGQLGAGAAHGIVFPRGLMLLARALVNLEATAAIMAPDRDFSAMAGSLLPELVTLLAPTPANLEEALSRNRLAYADVMLGLPDLLAELGQERRMTPVPPPRPRRIVSAAALGAAGALVASGLARRRS